MTHSKLFLMKFEMFGQLMKHCLKCLILRKPEEKKSIFPVDGKNIFCRFRSYRKSNTCNLEVMGILFG